MTISNIEKRYKTGIYIRLSKEDGDKMESDSIVNQRKILHKYLSEHPEFELYDEYVDDGYSGKDGNRPNFQRMLMDVERNKINAIIVKDLSRFGRNYVLNGELIEHVFPAKNIRFIMILDEYDSDKTNDAISDLMFPLKNVFVDYYSKDISRKVKKSFAVKQKNGEFIGAYACYGYGKDKFDKHKLVVDEYAAGIVRQIFAMYLSGMNLTQIANQLNDGGILSPSEYKKTSGSSYKCGNQILKQSVWTRSVISELLRNETYIGNLVQGKNSQSVKQKKKRVPKSDWIVVENTHEPIIDKETFDKVQSLLARNIRHQKKSDNDVTALFSGFLRCGDCGMSLSQRIQRQKYISYTCSNYTRYGHKSCSPHHITQNKLIEIVLDDLNRIIASVKDLNALVEKEKKGLANTNRKHKMKNLDLEIEQKRKRKMSAYMDFQDGILTKEDYLAFSDTCEKELSLLTQKKAFFEEEEKRVMGFENIAWIQNLLKTKKIEALDKDIIYEMIDCITIYDDKSIVIRYKFSEEFENLLDLYSEQQSV